uniref:CSON013263 protein n=1 Tax=Culicoides sonorensis TaxID=179676 RepID=A0A336M7G5_CULSO
MMSLVDYGSSDDSENDNDPKNEESSEKSTTDDEIEPPTEKISSPSVSKLPSARDLLGPSSNMSEGVLKNKYKAAEDQKIATLERHVKMVNTDSNTKMKNGKKICWSYRKGRCRFGSACTYAHDSDVQTVEGTDKNESNTGNPDHVKPKPKVMSGVHDKTIKKKRPGLSNGLVPGKKVVQMYKSLKNS